MGLLALLAMCCRSGAWFRLIAGASLIAWVALLVASLPRCVLPDGSVDGPCVALPLLRYIDMPHGSMYYLCAFAWQLFMPQCFRGKGGVVGPLLGVVLAMVMQARGFPHLEAPLSHRGGEETWQITVSATLSWCWQQWASPNVWWAIGNLVLGLSLSQLCMAGSGAKELAPGWLAALDRLCFGVCVTHVRVLEFLSGYVRPGLREFSLDAYVMDAIATLLGALLVSLGIFLFVQAPVEVAVSWVLDLCIGCLHRIGCWSDASEQEEGGSVGNYEPGRES